MNNSKFRFTLNMHSHRSQVSIPALFGDTAVSIFITLTDGGIPYVIEDGCFAVLRAKKADGKPLCNYCPIENNTTIRYDFTEQTTNWEGIVDCEISLYGKDGKLITSPKFIILVDERVVYDDDIPTSAYERTAFDRAYSAEVERIANEKARVEAEAIRSEAESLRNENEATRNAKEDERISNEDARTENELSRSLEETLRSEAEMTRALAESSRQENEETRIANEEARIEAEKEREENLEAVETAISDHATYIETNQENISKHDTRLAEHDTRLAEHDIRISILEGLSLNYIEDNDEAYEKAVPNGAAPYALLNSIGGNAYVKSKNYFNHALLGFHIIDSDDSHIDQSYQGYMEIVNDITNGVEEIEVPLAVPYGTYYLKMLYGKLGNYTPQGNVTAESPFTVQFKQVDSFGGVHYMDATVPSQYDEGSLSVVFTIASGVGLNHAVAVMVTDDTYATGFIPYEAPTHFPTPVTKVVSKGSNLFDYTKIFPQDGYKIEQIPTGVRVNGYNQYATLTPEQFLEMTGLKEGDTFTYSATRTLKSGVWGGDAGGFVFYGSGSHPGLAFGGSYNAGYITHTRTVPTPFNSNTAGRLHIFGSDNTVIDITNITITKGDKAAPNKPYKSEPLDTYTVPKAMMDALGEHYGMPFTTLDLDTKRFDASYGQMTLDGTRSWEKYESAGGTPYFRVPIGDNTVDVGEYYATYPKATISVSNSNVGIYLYASSGGGNFIAIRTPNASSLTLDKFKEWLQASPIEVLYKSTKTRETDVSSYLTDYNEFKRIEVEEGGRIVADNERRAAVPSTITYMVAKE